MSLVVPVLLYSSETWTVTQSEMNRLQAFHMRCQRSILNVKWSDRVRNTDISLRTGLAHIGTLIQRRRHALFGHVARMNEFAPAHMAMRLARDMAAVRSVPAGWRRPPGRPRSTWTGQIRKDTGVSIATTWTRALDRSRWRADATALHGYAT